MLRFAFLGLGLGAIYALASQGLVLVYRGSGVLNFAQGAMSAVGAFAYYELHVQEGWPVGAAVPAALVISGAAGAAMHFAVMRPLRAAPPLTRLIATLGAMTILQQAGRIRYGTEIRIVRSILPTRTVSPVPGAAVGIDRFLLVGIAFVVSATLWAVYRYTRFGLVTTAVAENERTAQLAGHSPDRIAVANWVLGSALAGMAGILLVPITGLDIDTLVLLIIPALAAGLLAGFDSFSIAFVASMVMGITQSEMIRYVSAPGWSQSVPFLFVIFVLVVRGRALPLRSHVNELLPEIGTGVLRRGPFVVGLAATAALIVLAPASWSDAFITSIIGAGICVSLVVVTGYAGQLSLAQFAFAGWAAYVAGRLAATQGLSFSLALVVGVAAAVPVGILVGLPALRTRGVNLAIATFGLAFAFQSILFSNSNYTGGLQGTVVKPASLFGWEIDSLNHPKRYALVCLVALLLVGLVAGNLRRGRAGRRLVAVRGNERAAASLGISVYGAKLYAFAVSAAMAGLGGVLLAFKSTYVNFGMFDVFSSVSVVIYTVIGGVGYLTGALIAGSSFAGGVTPRIVSEFVSSGNVVSYVSLVLAVLLIPTLIAYPNGLASGLAAQRGRKKASSPAIDSKDDDDSTTPKVHTGGRSLSAGGTPAQVTPRRLTVRDVRVRFGGVRALNGVTLEVGPGEVVGLMGPNGAGKTTLIDAVTGFIRVESGAILLDGEPVDRCSAQRRARLGIGRTFQSLELFEQLTVLENLRAASDPRDTLSYFTDLVRPKVTELPATALAAIEMFELDADLQRRPSELPYGRRRQVAIARAIAANPSILLLDEPAAGLNESETLSLGVLVRRLAEGWGMGILLVEHDVPMLTRVCDRLVAIDFGEVIGRGTPAEIRSDQRVVAAYLGESSDRAEEVTAERVD